MIDSTAAATDTLMASTVAPGRVPPAPADSVLFGRYHVLRELGRGGMGQVLLARDLELGQHVAVKIVPDLLVKDTEAVNDLKKEVLRGMALTHPGIVRTHNFERDAQGAAIIMEFVDGRTLSDLKAQQPRGYFAPSEILPWIEQLCAVLDYAHSEARIVHRDLKPRNLMVTSTGRLKVADFGISALLTETITRNTGDHMTSGTPSYMSPQQAMGKKPSPLDDVYAVGATIYELLTGKPPFFRGHILAQVAEEIPPRMAERCEEFGAGGSEAIPEAWEQTVAACLEKDAAKRPQTAGEIVRRLGGFEPHGIKPDAASIPAELSLAPDTSTSKTAPADLAVIPSTPVKLIPAELTYVRLPAEPRSKSFWPLLGWEFVGVILLGAGFWWMQREPTRQSAVEVVPAVVPASPVLDIAASTPAWISTQQSANSFPATAGSSRPLNEHQPTTVLFLPPPPPRHLGERGGPRPAAHGPAGGQGLPRPDFPGGAGFGRPRPNGPGGPGGPRPPGR